MTLTVRQTIVAAAGLACLVVGAFQASLVAGLVVLGVILVLVALLVEVEA